MCTLNLLNGITLRDLQYLSHDFRTSGNSLNLFSDDIGIFQSDFFILFISKCIE